MFFAVVVVVVVVVVVCVCVCVCVFVCVCVCVCVLHMMRTVLNEVLQCVYVISRVQCPLGAYIFC